MYKDRWIECTADAVLIRGYSDAVVAAITGHSSARVIDGPAVMA